MSEGDLTPPTGPPPGGQLLIYRDGAVNLHVRLDGQTVWLTQRQIADLYQIGVPTVNEHLANIYDEGEMDPSSTVRKYRIVQTEGRRQVNRLVDHYNLDVHGNTAAEVILNRADAEKPKMGLTSWKLAPDGLIRQADVEVAKNYLTEAEIVELNRIVSMYLDHAEDQARKKRPMHMSDWAARLDAFLQFNERNILTHAGKISHEFAIDHAHGEFEKYESRRLADEATRKTDFDKLVDESKKLQPQLPSLAEPRESKAAEAKSKKTRGRRKPGADDAR